jgi:hypothetical protein
VGEEVSWLLMVQLINIGEGGVLEWLAAVGVLDLGLFGLRPGDDCSRGLLRKDKTSCRWEEGTVSSDATA